MSEKETVGVKIGTCSRAKKEKVGVKISDKEKARSIHVSPTCLNGLPRLSAGKRQEPTKIKTRDCTKERGVLLDRLHEQDHRPFRRTFPAASPTRDGWMLTRVLKGGSCSLQDSTVDRQSNRPHTFDTFALAVGLPADDGTRYHTP